MDGDEFLFQSSVEYKNSPHLLSLSKYNLSWESSGKVKTTESSAYEPLVRHDSCIDLRDVIGVKCIRIPEKPSSLTFSKRKYKLHEDVPVCFEMQPLGPVGFSVYAALRSGNKWRYNHIAFQCKDSALCQQWIVKIREALKRPELNRPSNLIVFVNPRSGKRKAVKIFRDKVSPLFELAEINIQCIETERQNHARDLIQDSLDLTGVDGLVCVGGDGMFAEILNGLLVRSNREDDIDLSSGQPPVPSGIQLGLIPAGSTNTVVCTTTGVSDPVTSALQIILGLRLGIDVNSVYVNDKFNRFSVTMLGYGYMGDLLKDSETNSLKGPMRYNWSGMKAFLSNHSYWGEVRYRLSDNKNSHPMDQVRCYSGCETCSNAGSMAGSIVNFDLSAGSEDTGEQCSSVSSDDGWQCVKGKFVAINSVTMSCSCDLSPPGMSPYCHLGDGCMDLILVSECSRADFLRFLLRTAKGEERNNLGYTKIHRVKEFTFRTLTQDSDVDHLINTTHRTVSREKMRRQTSKTSVWNCDGEVIHNPEIRSKVHCQLVTLFARGVEDPATADDQNCQVCCSPTFDGH